ncbi:DDE-type integrase/transposase/recombinase [Deinococcus peraridilitoris]|uniref:DDE-type integrase/transposase/recombinase n=1 Tax=Deinococcus peraridilitoris TaxID=432329 RepID=UPI00059BB19D|nr:DDE-type integrase/transposase/recombinase [Deinococcus peraridilitoris]
MNEHGDVLDVWLQKHRDTKAAMRFFHRLLNEYDAPEQRVMDELWNYGAAVREVPGLARAEHVQVRADARKNNLIEQSHRSTRDQERQRAGVLKGVRSARDAGRRPEGRLAQSSPQSGLRACARPFCPRATMFSKY